eukprot:1121856-Amphidinium_carterae.3
MPFLADALKPAGNDESAPSGSSSNKMPTSEEPVEQVVVRTLRMPKPRKDKTKGLTKKKRSIVKIDPVPMLRKLLKAASSQSRKKKNKTLMKTKK